MKLSFDSSIPEVFVRYLLFFFLSPIKHCFFLGCALLSLNLSIAHAQVFNAQQVKAGYPDEVTIEALSREEAWLALLQYFDAGFSFGRQKSQADDQEFFLDDNGASNAAAELKTALKIFSQPQLSEYKKAACQFPARYHWIQQQFPHLIQPRPECVDFEKFRDEINIESVYLVFPVAYLNSPSSMFGHTFLRLKAAHRDNPLLDYAVNFAANADESENTILYSIRGLTGGYPGNFSVVPYYDKIKEYSFLDSRDIWEYELKLTANERAQLVRHIWEIRQIKFDYFFLSENCSYRLVTLLSAISDDINLDDNFRMSAVPADTLRFLQQTPGFGDISYRPSQVTQLRFQEKSRQKKELDLIQKVVLDPSEDAQTLLELDNPTEGLNLAYDYGRYVAAKEKRALPHIAKRSMELLSLRAKQPQNSSLKALEVPPPEFRDDQGHETLAITSSVGHNKQGDYLNFGIRGAYHDILDTPQGYPAGAQLELFHLQLRQGLDENKTQLQKLAFVNIFSHTRASQLVQPKSWQVGFGFQQFEFEDRLGGYLEGARGKTWAWQEIDISILAKGSLAVFDDTAFFDLGPSLQLLYQNSSWSASTSSQVKTAINRPFHSNHWRQDFGLAKHFDGWQLRTSGYYERFGGEELYSLDVGIRIYM